MPPVGLELTISTGERPQTYADHGYSFPKQRGREMFLVRECERKKKAITNGRIITTTRVQEGNTNI